ncbi:hypothetical protein [Candidatus Amarobacter glycogenicus]|uniref:hypothetical protein n=1 Tax=Candidatus Amarobacter glycogenicus TaxID=3140699 RepID=UPI002A0BADA9|nr:hypothetical protein [Dehalococcoidia bacterium]
MTTWKKQPVESRAQLRVARDKKLTERPSDELLGEMNSSRPVRRWTSPGVAPARRDRRGGSGAKNRPGTTWKDWTGNKVQINAERFAWDARQELNTNVQATQGARPREKAIIAGLGRAAAGTDRPSCRKRR